MVFGFGAKKDIEKYDIPLPPLPELPKRSQDGTSDIVDARMLTEEKGKLMQWLLQEFKENYGGIVNSRDLEHIDVEATSLNLLFGIWSEIRIARLTKGKE